jgi:uncharacterized membrane protein
MENKENNKVEEVVAAPAVHPKKGMAIASLVLGIVSAVFSCLWFISVPCAVIAIILGILANKAGKIGMATAGLILGIIGIVFTVLGLTLLASFIASFGASGLAQ